MKLRILVITAALAVLPSLAQAGGSCTSYKSGSYTRTSCSSSGGYRSSTVSYMSGSYRKFGTSHSYRGRSWSTGGVSYNSGSHRKTYWH